jgi:tripartite-type tricarboxylate transporter receptor subunit TctC
MTHASMTTLAMIATALAASTFAASAQGTYPNKPIRLVAPEVVGSATDLLARVIAPRLGKELGQPVEIVNLFGKEGLDMGAKAAPDGYTLTYGSAGTLALLPHIDKTVKFDSFKDFLPVSLYAINPTLLAVHPSLAAANVKELIALIKANPANYTMSTAGQGTAGHFAGALFIKMAGIDPPVVHYPGGGPAIDAVVNNIAPWTFAPIAGRLPHVRSGKLKALATGASVRLTVLPDVPTVAESGVPGYESVGWAGIWAPKGTPAPIIDKLNAAIVKIIATEELKAAVQEQGSQAQSSTPAELAKRLREEYDRIGEVAKLAGMVQ